MTGWAMQGGTPPKSKIKAGGLKAAIRSRELRRTSVNPIRPESRRVSRTGSDQAAQGRACLGEDSDRGLCPIRSGVAETVGILLVSIKPFTKIPCLGG